MQVWRLASRWLCARVRRPAQTSKSFGFVALVPRPSLALCWRTSPPAVDAVLVLKLLRSSPLRGYAARELVDALRAYAQNLPDPFIPSPGQLAAWFACVKAVIFIAPDLAGSTLRVISRLPREHGDWLSPITAAEALPEALGLVEELLKLGDAVREGATSRILSAASSPERARGGESSARPVWSSRLGLLDGTEDIVLELSKLPWVGMLAASRGGQAMWHGASGNRMSTELAVSRKHVALCTQAVYELCRIHSAIVIGLHRAGRVRNAMSSHEAAVGILLPLTAQLERLREVTSASSDLRNTVHSVHEAAWCLDALLVPALVLQLKSYCLPTNPLGGSISTAASRASIEDRMVLFKYASSVLLRMQGLGDPVSRHHWVRLVGVLLEWAEEGSNRYRGAPVKTGRPPTDVIKTLHISTPSSSAAGERIPSDSTAYESRVALRTPILPFDIRYLREWPPAGWNGLLHHMRIPQYTQILRHPLLRPIRSRADVERQIAMVSEQALLLAQITSTKTGGVDHWHWQWPTTTISSTITDDSDSSDAQSLPVDGAAAAEGLGPGVAASVTGRSTVTGSGSDHAASDSASDSELGDLYWMPPAAWLRQAREVRVLKMADFHVVDTVLARVNAVAYLTFVPNDEYAAPWFYNPSMPHPSPHARRVQVGWRDSRAGATLSAFRADSAAPDKSRSRSAISTLSTWLRGFAMGTAAAAAYVHHAAFAVPTQRCDDIAVQLCVSLRRKEAKWSAQEAAHHRANTGFGRGLTSDIHKAAMHRAAISSLSSSSSNHTDGGGPADEDLTRTQEMLQEVAWLLASAHASIPTDTADLAPLVAEHLSASQLAALRYMNRRCDDVLRFSRLLLDVSRLAQPDDSEGWRRLSQREAGFIHDHLQAAVSKAVLDVVRLGERLCTVVPDAAVLPISALLVEKCDKLLNP